MKNLLFLAMPLLLAGCNKGVIETPSNLKMNSVTKKGLNSTGNVYYVDTAGNDSNNGLSTSTPWKTLAKVTATTFHPGDQILFKAGETWSGTLTLVGSGSSGLPIIINMYGTGSRPCINGPGTNGSHGLQLWTRSYWEVNNLEVTNTQPTGGTNGLNGILINGGSTTAANHIYIKNCYVHDVNSVGYGTGGNANYSTTHGGIVYTGQINDVLISNCRISNSSVSGLRYTNSGAAASNVVIQQDTIENVYGDGIMMAGVTAGLITHNVIHNACMSQDVNAWYAGCWTMNSTGSTVSYNEVYGLNGGYTDGEPFDADNNSNGDIFEYNYSHDNSRGFIEFMPTSQATIVRYNMSINDCSTTSGIDSKLFNYQSTSSTAQIYNNTIYVGNNIANVFRNDKNNPFSGTFNNNIIYCTGTVNSFCYGAAPSTSSSFNNNCFYPASMTNTYGPPSGSISGTINADPSFVSPGASPSPLGLSSPTGYQLNNGSPCDSAGVVMSNNGGIDYFGTGLPAGSPDIGASQH
jgi:hypothetical protein